MRTRPLVAAALALVALVAAAPADAAPTTYRLDGKRTKSQSYTGFLSTPVVPLSSSMPDPSVPHDEDCAETSCDISRFQLALPKGTSYGQLKVSVMVPSTLNAALIVYGRSANKRYVDEIWRTKQGEPPPQLDSPYQYPLEIALPVLPAGTYTVVVMDRFGLGEFRAKVEWTAHPPDRR